MRIEKLDLIRYGHFTGYAIDLPSRQPDYTVVYGDNEAGKSTLLRGISALFFGVPAKTPDVHSCKGTELRIGATISNQGDRISFRRRKGSSGTLLSPDEVQIDESVLAPFLRELDRQRFNQFFGLDHQSLREGGEEILHGKGDVGSALFQAAGLLDLRKLLERLDKEANELFSPQSKGRVIGTAISEYKEAKQTIRTVAISATKAKDLKTELDKAQEKHENLKSEARSLQQDLVRLRRIATNKPDVAKLQELRLVLGALGTVSVLPGDARKQRDDAATVLSTATNEIQTLNEQIAQRKEWIQAQPENESLKTQAADIEQLNAEIGDYIRSVNDLPRRNHELDEFIRLAEEQWREVWRKHPIEDAERLRPTYSRKSEILDLITAHARLLATFERASEQLQEEKEEHARLTEELSRDADAPDPATLLATIDTAKSLGDVGAEIARLRSASESLNTKATRELQALALWSGNIEQLEKLKIPLPGTVDRYSREWEVIANKRSALQLRVAAITQSVTDKRNELKQYAGKISRAGESDLADIRGRRDRLWQLIRASSFDGSLSPEEAHEQSGVSASLPESFSQHLRSADEISDLRFTHAKDVVINDRLNREIASALSDLQTTEEEGSKLTAEESDLQQRWSKEWGSLGVIPLPPSEMKQWMQLRQGILALLEQARQKENELALKVDRVSIAAGEIRSALSQVGMPLPADNESLAVMIKVAEGTARELGQRRRSIQELNRRLQLLQLDKRQEVLAECESELSQWSAGWAPFVQGLLLPESATSKQVQVALEVLEKVFEHLRDAEHLRHRVKRIGDNIREFQNKSEQLAQFLDPALANLSPQAAVTQLHLRLVDGGKAETARAAWERENQVDERVLADCRARAQAASSAIMKLKQLANCDDDLQFEAALAAAEQKYAREQDYSRIAQGLIERNAIPDLKRIEEEASGFDLDTLQSEIASREFRQKTLEDEELFNAARDYIKMSQEYERLQASEESALQAQKAESALAKLRPAVAQYLRLRLASEILQRAMESYREKHQGAVLQRASELFSRLTLGEHSGLTTAFSDNDKQVLVAVRKNKEHVEVKGLSDGTLDQLYLSLRLAAIEDHVARVAPCPIILDDTLINSDDARASAALEVFAEFSMRTQVLLFTHHRHLAELATRAGAQLIELGCLAVAAEV